MGDMYPNLIREIKARNITMERFATSVGLSKSALYRRLRGSTDWKLTEIVKVCQALDNLDASELFLRLDTKS